MQTALICNEPDGRTKLVLLDAIKNNVQETHFLEKWDMKLVNPIRTRPQLTPFQNNLLKEVMQSRQGHALLNKLKNGKGDTIINKFIKNIVDELPTTFKDHTEKEQKIIKCGSTLKNFLEAMIEEPLIGDNGIKNVSIGLTKFQIWDAFVANGLIVKE